jgi:hypothetical protein
MTITKQEALDKVTEHLSKMTERAGRFYTPDYSPYEEQFACTYRNDRGERCAIGALLPDHLIEEAADHEGSVDTLCSENPDIAEFLDVYDAEANSLNYDELDFFTKLQDAHDASVNWDEGVGFICWDELADLAALYDLEFTWPSS